MFKAFKYRIFPTKEQEILLNKHIGSVRFLYNLALETKKAAYACGVTLNRYDLQAQLKELKKECVWLKEVNSQSLQVALMNLDAAYLRFFKGQNSFPTFKNKTNRRSFNVPQNVILENAKIFIPKFKKGIDIVLHRQIKGIIRQATITRTPTGKYFASILCENIDQTKPKAEIKENTTIGIDLGIKSFLVLSNGREFNNPKFLRMAQSKLQYLQRKYCKHKGKRTKNKIARLHEKIANKRKDFLQKTSTELINSHDSLAIEDLSVLNMVKNHNLALSISDAGWASFIKMLKYKAEWYGKNILKIGRFEPSSKLHANCGHTNKALTLSDREWICPKCCELVSRDVNSAINIKNFALKNKLSVESRLKNRRELPTLVGVMTSEAQTSL